MNFQLIQQAFQGHLEAMARSLPDSYCLTLVARHTNDPDAAFIMTGDDLTTVIQTIQDLSNDHACGEGSPCRL